MKSVLIGAFAATAGALLSACGTQGYATPRATVTVTAPPASHHRHQHASTTAATGAGTGTQVSAGASTPASSGAAPVRALASLPPAGCLSRYLAASAGLSQGAAGSTYQVIVFKNLDNHPCSLYGYPGVSQASGVPVTQIGRAAAENPATPRRLVILRPHGYANALLRIEDASLFPPSQCHPVTASWLQIFPPNQSVPLYLSYTSSACASRHVRLLTIDTVRPGTGG